MLNTFIRCFREVERQLKIWKLMWPLLMTLFKNSHVIFPDVHYYNGILRKLILVTITRHFEETFISDHLLLGKELF